MSHVGQIIDGASLEDREAIDAAHAAALGPRRFDWVEVTNESRYWIIELFLFQGLDQQPPVPRGYQADTGVTVGATNLYGPSGRTRTTLQPQVRVQATRVKGSSRCRRLSDGKIQTITHRDHVSPAGRYIVGARFGIVDANPNDPTGELLVTTLFAESDTAERE